MKNKVIAMYFSATGTTKKVVSEIAKLISEDIGEEVTDTINFTLPGVRENSVTFNEADLVIIGVPVIAGRVPNVLLKYLNSITGNGALAVPIVLYGNRNYDDALIELADILEAHGFKIIAGAAFIGEHSFSKILAKDRPDDTDMAIVRNFANQIYKKITQDNNKTVVVRGNKPYRGYYMPKTKDGIPVDMRKITPKTNSNCNKCLICVPLCPMGSIDSQDISKFNGICIRCCSCVKNCPAGARYFDDENFIRHKSELEINYADRKEPEFFI
ncbi:MAG TPA: EFR1 family ferrodoxin [Syntrophomonadaceae bacterium]|nr:EFR1 family ferrodoxin [Syntrophomonadaceae bacterium]